jgi:hypothetical protein
MTVGFLSQQELPSASPRAGSFQRHQDHKVEAHLCAVCLSSTPPSAESGLFVASPLCQTGALLDSGVGYRRLDCESVLDLFHSVVCGWGEGREVL